MSDLGNAAEPGSGPAYEPPPPSAGAVLASARESAGLSIDAVAQQLKLAPRQVQALEDDDFAALPGRTFVRGFVRNYARFVGLDPDEVVALLPGADVAPSLSRPTITPSSRPMGHLPADAPPRRSWTGWLIALVLVAIVAAAGVYEFRRPQGETRHVDKAPAAAPAPAPSAGATTSGGTTSATLPNPLGDAPNATPASAPDAAQSAVPSAPAGASAPGAPSATAATTPPEATAATPPSPPASGNEPTLVLTFKGTSWAQVKDRNGNTLIAQNFPAGTTQSVSGPLPLDIVIGNAPQVTATFRGQNVDLSPLVRGTVARLSVK